MTKPTQGSLFDDPLPTHPVAPTSTADRIAKAHAEIRAAGKAHAKFVAWFLDCPHWICGCRATNFGRNKRCPGCGQPRPADYVENTYPG